MDEGIQRLQAEGKQEEEPGQGGSRIDGPDPGGKGDDAGRRRVAMDPRLGAEELHPADAQLGQENDGHEDEPDPPEPLEDGPPEQEAGREGLQARHHRRPGGGDPGGGLEEGVHEGEGGLGEKERQGAEEGGGDPRDGDDEESLARGRGRRALGGWR